MARLTSWQWGTCRQSILCSGLISLIAKIGNIVFADFKLRIWFNLHRSDSEPEDSNVVGKGQVRIPSFQPTRFTILLFELCQGCCAAEGLEGITTPPPPTTSVGALLCFRTTLGGQSLMGLIEFRFPRPRRC